MLNGTTWVDEIRSVSLPGLSSIILIFEKGTDIMRARQVVQERLTEVFALPNVSKPPTMINPLSSASRCMTIGLTSDKLSLIDMSVLARWTIVPRLMGLPGVANVSIWGERQRQLQVKVDPERLRDEGLTLNQIIKTTGNSLWASPLSFLEASTPGTGGWVDTPNQRLGIRHILPITTAEELGQVPIDNAISKRLSDVATVVEDHQPLIGDAIVNDAPALMLIVEKFPWASTIDVTEEVEEALTAMRPGLSGLEIDSSLFRPATFLELAADNLYMSLLISTILMIIAFFAFLFNWRTALISSVSVLMSVLVAGAVLYVSGIEINLMIVAGILLALGAIIDNAIVDMKNVISHLNRAREDGSGKSTATIIVEAVFEMRSSLLYATLIMLLAVMPVIFIEGVSGAFWQPLVYSFILALVSSTVVALIVTPSLSLLFLRNASLTAGDSPIAGMLRGIYNGLFAWVARTPRPVFVAVCAVAVIGVLTFSMLRQESILPELKETDLVVRMDGSSSASHPAMVRLSSLAIKELRSIPGVHNVSAHLGRAVMSDKRRNINSGELWIRIHPSADYEKTVNSVKQVVSGYPSLSPEMLTFLQAKVRDELSGTGKSLVVRVYGDDMNMIVKKAEEVQRKLGSVKGIVDPKVQYPSKMPTLEIELDIERAKHYGLKPGDVRRATTSLMSGIGVGSLFEEQKVFDVVVWGTDETRHSLTSLKNLLIDAPSGDSVRLHEVADVRIVPTATEIHRDAVARRVDVTATMRGRDIVSVAADIESRIREINFPLEYRAELLGEYAEGLAVQKRVMAFALAVAIGIFLLLQVFFRSWRLATVVFLTLPMALLGGALAVFLIKGGLVSIGSSAGFIAVLAIAVRNSITMVDCYRKLEKAGEDFGVELVQRGTSERSEQILMTAITTALVFLPLIFFGNIAGLEIVQPMAVVVLGGLITTSLLALMGVPAMYLLFGEKKEPDLGLEEPQARVVIE
jgi:Cu/Ag efflux pump CusA